MKNLSDRMKEYEDAWDYKIIHRLPIILRLDGCGFSRFTKTIKAKKPFDKNLSNIMVETTKYVASKIQGCLLGYTQSDEISLIIRTDQSLEAIPWFNNRISKMVSVSASLASAMFNKLIDGDKLASFDCRVIAFPNMAEVVNCLIFRQQDAIRNSILNAGIFDLGKKFGMGTARKMIFKKKCDELQELLFQNGINWNNYPAEYKRGVVIYREENEIETSNGKAIRKPWVFSPAPIFKSDDGRAWLNIILGKEKNEL